MLLNSLFLQLHVEMFFDYHSPDIGPIRSQLDLCKSQMQGPGCCFFQPG